MKTSENNHRGAPRLMTEETPSKARGPSLRPDVPSPQALEDRPKELRCPRCRRVLLRVHRAETVYLGRVTQFRGEKADAACPNCKTRIEVPLKLELIS